MLPASASRLAAPLWRPVIRVSLLPSGTDWLGGTSDGEMRRERGEASGSQT